MSLLDTIMTNTGMPAFRRVLGDEATYTPAVGDPVATWSTFSRGSSMEGESSERHEPRFTAKLPISDVPEPKPGDHLTIKSVVYRIDQVIGSNNLFIEVSIR